MRLATLQRLALAVALAAAAVPAVPQGDREAINEELRRRGFGADVYFAFDDSALSDETRERLSRNADVLERFPRHQQLQLLVEGHTDERGLNEYNLALGERRANAVKDYLTSLGVSVGRLSVLSYGEERPVCSQPDESCWSQNRRVRMVVTGTSNPST